MFAQIDQSEYYACRKENSKDERCDSLCFYRSDWDVAGGRVDECTIEED